MTALSSIRGIALALLVLAGLRPGAALAEAAAVSVSASTVVLTGEAPTAEFVVGNMTGELASFRIAPVFFVMQPDGMLRELPDPAAPSNTALGLVRFGPRQFELDPGQGQVVGLALRGLDKIDDGEYRIHLRVTRLDAPDTPTALGDGNRIAPVVKVNVARAVRILVRKGVEAGSAMIDDLVLETGPEGRRLRFSLVHASGSLTATGQVLVALKAGGKVVQSLPPVGGSLYGDLSRRDMLLPLPGKLAGASEVCVIWQGMGTESSATAPQICTPL